MRKKITVSIGIPAYNEEKNIQLLLQEILKQKQLSYVIKEIIIASDGSNDNTAHCIKMLQNSKIKVIGGTKRLGQNYRINDLLKRSTGEIIIIIEADTLPTTNITIEKLIKPFLLHSSKQLVTVGAWREIKAKSFYEKLVQFGNDFKLEVFRKWRNGSNVYLYGGHSIKAFSKSTAKTFQLPLDVPEDSYLYLHCKSNNIPFKYLPQVHMVFKNVSNIQDRVKQSKKFLDGQVSLKKYFSQNFVEDEYTIPKVLILKQCFISLLENPVLLLIFSLDLTINRLINFKVKKFNPLYDIYSSSKELRT